MDTPATLTPLLAYLDSLSAKVDLEILGKLLRQTNVRRNDIEKFCIFNEKSYHRNRISGSDWYDLMVMCWRPGQSSPIHDHFGSSCGLRIVTGRAKEVRYRLSRPGYARPAETRVLEQDEICLAREGDIHLVMNEGSSDLITIHIYSPPLQMNIYEEESDGLHAVPD